MTTFEATANAAGDCHYTIDIRVPAIEVEAAYKKIRKKVRKQARIPGFRPGKAPNKMIDKRFGEQIKEEVQQDLVRETLPAALKENELEPLTYPRMADGQNPDAKEGEDFTFVIEFDVRPEFELPDYESLELETHKVESSDEHVDKAIHDLLQSRASYGVVDREAAPEDMLKVGYTSELPLDDEVPDAAKRMLEVDETWVLLSEPEVIPGITEGLTGVSAGDEKELEIEFPAGYYEPFLENKTVKYTFKIMEVHGRTVPELTDDLAQEMGAEDAENLRHMVKERIDGQLNNVKQEHLRNQIIEKLLDTLDFPLPPQIFEAETEMMENQLAHEEAQQKDQQTEASEDDDGAAAKETREQERHETAAARAAEQLRLRYVIEKIADQEGINVDPSEVRSQLATFQAYQGLTEEQFRERYDEMAVLDSIHTNSLRAKVLDALAEKAAVTEVDPPGNDDDDDDDDES